ncbi:MAG: hypothetical protein ACM3PE_04495 [Deltaproteobacteria bacterium]
MRPRISAQGGNAMLTVVVLIFVIALLGASAYSISSNYGQLALRSADYDDALHHAEQVCNRYLWLFNHDPDILDDTSKYTAMDDSAVNPTKRIYTQKDTVSEYYKVSVEIPYLNGISPPKLATNYAIVKVTAWPPKYASSKRTIQAELVKRTFTSNGLSCNSEKNKSNVPVKWDTGESFYGNFHTNSTLYIETSGSPVFYGPVSYSDNKGINPWGKASDTTIFRKGVTQTEKIEWPGSNTKLMEEARSGGAGFYSKGRACIMLRGEQFDIRYWDDDAKTWKYNGVSYEYQVPSGVTHLLDPLNDEGNFYVPSKTSPSHVYTSFSQLKAAVGHLELPENRIIYIGGNTPASDYADVHDKFARDLGNIFIGGKVKGGLTIASSNDIFICAYDPTNWKDPWLIADVPYFKSFEATSGIKYADTSYSLMPSSTNWDYTEVTGTGKDTDYLGLVAQNDMYIMHSSWPAQIENLSADPARWFADVYSWGMKNLLGITLSDSSAYDIEVDGALLCVDGDFGFESYSSAFAYKGNFTLFGSLSQNTTGNLGSNDVFADGYERRYIQDPRMKTMSPPHFLDPADTGWQMANWAETDQHL